MKQTNVFLCLLAAVFALTLAACPDNTSSGGGGDGKTVQSITLNGTPAKTAYSVGEAFDLTGLTIDVTYTDSTTSTGVAVTAAMIRPMGWNMTAGSKTLTVEYGGKSVSLAAVTVTAGGTPAFTGYIITGSGTAFTAKKGGTTVTNAGGVAIDAVLTAIRTDANNAACEIQFGDGTATLNIGTASAQFNTTGGTWGTVTLSGKITSAITATNSGTIHIAGAVSVTTTADITNTGNNNNSRAVYNASTATLTISGGTISATTGSAVYNGATCTVNITDGTLTAPFYAVYNSNGSPTVNISGGSLSGTGSNGQAVYIVTTGKTTVSGTANLTGANTSATGGTIDIWGGSGTAVRLDIQGGTITNTSSTTGNTIFNNSTGAITISGGTITKAGGTGNGYAINNASTGTVTISGTPTITGDTTGVTTP